MLKDTDAMATIGVKDLKKAREFYEGKIGLVPGPTEEEQVIGYKAGNSIILVYKSGFAGTNQATAVTWAVDDVAKVVDDLKSKGVTFERYEFPGVKHEGDVHVMGNRKNAWFKDPDGNILSVVNK
jgi:catechol 2,3-dioxygenase-like lactoylglutathione lyase family enzyme